MHVMRLRALGGVMSGSFAELEEGQRDHFFRQNVRYNPARAVNNGPQEPVKQQTLHRYTRRKIVTPNGDIEFLAPEAWNDWQALQSALGGSFSP